MKILVVADSHGSQIPLSIAKKNIESFDIMFYEKNWLFTHAGVSSVWAKKWMKEIIGH